MAGEIDGPRLESRGGPAKRLVVFLHGYGADGNDLIGLGRELSLIHISEPTRPY